jgi:hypothetical protein
MIGIQENGDFTAILKNHGKIPLKGLKLFGESSHFDVKILPEKIDNIRPKEEIPLKVSLRLKSSSAQEGWLRVKVAMKGFKSKVLLKMEVQPGTSPEEKVLLADVEPEAPFEEAGPESIGEVRVRIRRTTNLRYYLYGILCALIVGLFTWRKLRLSRSR